ncbi:Fc.00g078520.m01.CDS01 [Cosmosporella sp. VM-42]
MASSSNAPRPLRRQASTNSMNNGDNNDLALSLKKLTISTSPRRGPSHLSEPTTPFRSTSRRSSHSPNPRPPSRSPSHVREPGPGTPTLLRKASMNSLRSASGTGSGHTPLRRASSGFIGSPTTKASPFDAAPPIPEKPIPTATSIANEFFKAELEAHHGSIATRQTDTVVVLNDAVYGHRFSRPRTSRSALSTIVERPERIKAGVLGISAAYVRLGERHCEGEFPVHPKLDVHSLPSVPFRIHKTTRRLPLTSQAVTNVHGTRWMEELKMMCEAAESKLAMGGKELQRPEMNRGTNEVPPKFHEGDLYLCSESLNAMEGALGAVCEAVDTVFGPGPRRAFVGTRPPGHHCSADFPSGFCWVNNVHVGIMHAALNHGLTHAAIVDFDLHHGDGSQAITWQHNTRGITAPKNAAAWKKSSIGYFSLHDINSYPCEMGDEEKVKNASLCIDNAHGQTVWNIHLQSWKSEQEFWGLYESKYMVLLDKVRNYLKNQADRLRLTNQLPKAAIFFSAGFDASEWESAGMQRHQVNVPTEFYARIAQDVIKLAAEEGLHVDGRVISVLEGGYSDRALFSGIFSHLSGLAGDQIPDQFPAGGLGAEMRQKIGVVAEDEETEMPLKPSLASVHTYDPTWWASSNLDDLENAIADPLAPPKIVRTPSIPTYCSPTQASTAKVADPIKMRRSLSGLAQASMPPRPPTPPPPEVPWTIAVHELSKLLIPSERQTDSCKPEDLNAEATRARRDRQSVLMGVPPVPPAPVPGRPSSRMALRERKVKAAIPVEEVGMDKSSKNRRRTVAHTTLTVEKAAARGIPSETDRPQPVRRTSRRLSETPTVLSPADNPQRPPYVSGVNRPGTSQNGRPTSVMSSRTQSADSLPVKKNRATAARKETVPRGPRGTKKTATTASHVKSKTTQNSPAKPGPASDDPEDDMDNITSGMKKIRINLITPAQKEAREKARLEAQKAASPPAEEKQTVLPSIEQPSVTPSPEPEVEPEITAAHYTDPAELSPRQPAPSSSPIATPPTTVPSSGLSTPLQEQMPFSVPSPDAHQVALPESSPIIPSVAIQLSDINSNVFIPYQPEGPAPVPVFQHEPLKWLPPNAPTPSANTPAATPSPAKHKNLFQYTGASGIPFAPRPQQGVQPTNDTKLEVKPPSSIWEVPQTPQK